MLRKQSEEHSADHPCRKEQNKGSTNLRSQSWKNIDFEADSFLCTVPKLFDLKSNLSLDMRIDPRSSINRGSETDYLLASCTSRGVTKRVAVFVVPAVRMLDVYRETLRDLEHWLTGSHTRQVGSGAREWCFPAVNAMVGRLDFLHTLEYFSFSSHSSRSRYPQISKRDRSHPALHFRMSASYSTSELQKDWSFSTRLHGI